MTSSRSPISTHLKIWGILLACMAMIVTAGGSILMSLGLRYQYPDLTPAEPSQAEQTRQQLAVQAQKIAASQDISSENTALFDAADSWVSQLGGVWVPWPEGAPEGYENPDIDTSGYATIEEVRRALWTFSSEVYIFDASALSESELSKSELSETAPSESEGENHASASSQLGPALGIDAMRYAIELDRKSGRATECTAPDPQQIEKLGEDIAHASNPQVLSDLSTAQQALEHQAALAAGGLDDASEESPKQAAAASLTALIDAALGAGGKDSRPVMAPPPADEASAIQAVVHALAGLTLADSSASKETTQAFSCAVLNQLA